jgi:hypothetical protein|tara:strand:+ start:745 stop:978 length:234 start_codon:yes stop_codon:yes gene_type:complete
MLRIWIGASVVWVLGLYAFAWLDTNRLWPPVMPTEMFGWLTWSAIFFGPPLLALLLGYGIFSKSSKQGKGTEVQEDQ